jgi:aspartate/methionine/tyrosine aminotransferase
MPFAFAQAIVDPSRVGATVIVPNPFYQIYEGATLLAGATPHYVNSLAANDFAPQWHEISDAVWARTQLVYVCSPDNPTGRVASADDWRTLFELSDRHGFAIASDECYSEIYCDESRPPLGALAAAAALGRDGFPRLVVFGSLSKRSNCPGLRSGYVAGDAALIKAFLLYRTYHGSAMSPAVAAAISRSAASFSCTARQVSRTSLDVMPWWTKRASGPTCSARLVRNAIVSWWTSRSISRIRSTSKAPFSRTACADRYVMCPTMRATLMPASGAWPVP